MYTAQDVPAPWGADTWEGALSKKYTHCNIFNIRSKQISICFFVFSK